MKYFTRTNFHWMSSLLSVRRAHEGSMRDYFPFSIFGPKTGRAHGGSMRDYSKIQTNRLFSVRGVQAFS